MKKENQNKLFGELAALSELPKNIQFNANSTWAKLEQQLEPKKKNKYYWLWIAASAIIVIAITWLNINTGEKLNPIVTKNYNKPIYPLTHKSKPEIVSREGIKKTSKKKSKIFEEIIPVKNIVLETKIDTAQPIIASDKITTRPLATIVGAKPVPIKKKLKVVYASDLYEENSHQILQKELAKEQPKKSFFKFFETPVNKETEDNITQENQQQPTKTFLGFKSKPTAPISINENQ